MKGIFEIVFLVSFLIQRLAFSAPVKKPTKSPIVIHCDLEDSIRQLIYHLPNAVGTLDQTVYRRYQTIVSSEKEYLHNHLHLHSTQLWSSSALPNNQIQLVQGPLQSNQTVPSLLGNSSFALSCSFCSLRESKKQYTRFPNSSTIVKGVDDILEHTRDLISEIRKVGSVIKPGSTYKTTCSTCQIHLTKGNRSRKQIALDLALALENLHGKLLIMKNNFSALRRASCAPARIVVGQSS